MFVYYIHKVYIINEIQKMKKNLSLVIGFSIVFQIFCPFAHFGCLVSNPKKILYICVFMEKIEVTRFTNKTNLVIWFDCLKKLWEKN